MSKKILVVDDSAAARQSVRIPLQRYGYQCIEAVDGIDALRRLSEEKFDMIITDIHMPNMGGLELLNGIRNSCKLKHLPVIVLSVESGETLRNQVKESGASGFIVKPFHFVKFIKFMNLSLK